ncbi:MAG: hypothetical protein ACRDQ2_06855 [Gaiellales bacterium]
MDVRKDIVGAVLTLAVILGLFWGIWLAGWLAFDSGGEIPPAEGRGVPTTVTTGKG